MPNYAVGSSPPHPDGGVMRMSARRDVKCERAGDGAMRTSGPSRAGHVAPLCDLIQYIPDDVPPCMRVQRGWSARSDRAGWPGQAGRGWSATWEAALPLLQHRALCVALCNKHTRDLINTATTFRLIEAAASGGSSCGDSLCCCRRDVSGCFTFMLNPVCTTSRGSVQPCVKFVPPPPPRARAARGGAGGL